MSQNIENSKLFNIISRFTTHESTFHLDNIKSRTDGLFTLSYDVYYEKENKKVKNYAYIPNGGHLYQFFQECFDTKLALYEVFSEYRMYPLFIDYDWTIKPEEHGTIHFDTVKKQVNDAVRDFIQCYKIENDYVIAGCMRKNKISFHIHIFGITGFVKHFHYLVKNCVEKFFYSKSELHGEIDYQQYVNNGSLRMMGTYKDGYKLDYLFEGDKGRKLDIYSYLNFIHSPFNDEQYKTNELFKLDYQYDDDEDTLIMEYNEVLMFEGKIRHTGDYVPDENIKSDIKIGKYIVKLTPDLIPKIIDELLEGLVDSTKEWRKYSKAIKYFIKLFPGDEKCIYEKWLFYCRECNKGYKEETFEKYFYDDNTKYYNCKADGNCVRSLLKAANHMGDFYGKCKREVETELDYGEEFLRERDGEYFDQYNKKYTSEDFFVYCRGIKVSPVRAYKIYANTIRSYISEGGIYVYRMKCINSDGKVYYKDTTKIEKGIKVQIWNSLDGKEEYKPLAEFMDFHSTHLIYHGCEFRPKLGKFFIVNDKRFLNSFTGFMGNRPLSQDVVTKLEEGFNVINDHILNLCGKSIESYNHFITFLAYIIQKPEEKQGVAQVLYSERQGVGKTELFEDFFSKYVMGYSYFIKYNNMKDALKRFESSEKKFLVVFEEATRGKKTQYAKMNDMITSGLRNLEKKGIQQDESQQGIPDYRRFVILTNHKDSVPVGQYDRRYHLMHSVEDFANNREYHDHLRQFFTDEMGQLFYNFLNTWNVRCCDIRTPPNTEMKLEVIEECDPYFSTLSSIRRGDISCGMLNGNKMIFTTEEFINKMPEYSRQSAVNTGKRLTKICKDAKYSQWIEKTRNKKCIKYILTKEIDTNDDEDSDDSS